MKEACGLFGIDAPGEEVANLTYFGLYALQHRGQESAGIATGDGRSLRMHKDVGLVAQAFDQLALDRLTGHLALGHTRYSTTGSNRVENAQPMIVEHPELGSIAIAHNGNLTNAESLRRDLEQQGIRFKTSSDTEVIAELLAHTSGFDILAVMRRALPRLQGAYCLLLLTRDCLVGVRDPLGIRPLSLGRLGETGHIITSETCALDTVGAEFVREVEPGEAVLLGHGIPVAEQLLPSVRKATCMFEFIYFARPDSRLQGQSLYEARRNMGRELAREAPADGDIVISLPDSGTPAAVGFAEASGIPFSEGLIKSRYITRTFIQPNERLRNVGIKLKFNPLREILQGKRVVLVDDSIVRGTTSRKIVEELRRAGTREIHMRVSSPPIQWPCFMGIDIASRSELIASGRSVEDVERLIGADSLKYLSKAGLLRAVKNATGFCMACFDGDYPVPVPVQLEMDKLALEPVAR
ncbi:MAG: amidophosphoribosyltransferase [Chloroflexi bacterium]|nr:MAG: amidophosphoribosyltransferase [Chloroflexota bacterium]TME47920.1 MAG: amidophosphoribosyltransferase [Chloroflexota bacterium]